LIFSLDPYNKSNIVKRTFAADESENMSVQINNAGAS